MDQKRRERKFLDLFKQRQEGFPPGLMIQPQPPAPDCLVQSGPWIVGIEMTDYIRDAGECGSRLRQVEQEQRRVEALARQQFEKLHGAPLIVYFKWLSREPLGKAGVKELAQIAANAVAVALPTSDGDSTEIHSSELPPGIARSHLRGIRILRGYGSLWARFEASFISVTVEEMQRVLDRKDAKADGYRAQCDELWLLITAEGRYLSSNMSIHEDVRQHHYQSAFDRVFVLDELANDVLELIVRKPTGSS